MDTSRALLVAEFRKLARIIDLGITEIQAARLVDTRVHIEPCQKLADAAIVVLELDAVLVDGMLERAEAAADEDTITVLDLEVQKNEFLNRHLGPLNEVLRQTAALLGFDSVEDVKAALALDRHTLPTLSTEMLEHLVLLNGAYISLVRFIPHIYHIDVSFGALARALRGSDRDDGISSLPRILQQLPADAFTAASLAQFSQSVRENIELNVPNEMGNEAEAIRRHKAMDYIEYFDYSVSKLTLAMLAVFKEAQRRRTPAIAFFYADLLSGMTMPENAALRFIDRAATDLFKACEEDPSNISVVGGSTKTSKRRRSSILPSSVSAAVLRAPQPPRLFAQSQVQVKVQVKEKKEKKEKAKAKARSKSPKRLRK